jgi:hypothetical protein
MSPITGALISGCLMMLLAATTVVVVRRLYVPAYRWFLGRRCRLDCRRRPKLILGAFVTVPMLKVFLPLFPFSVYKIVGGLCMGLFSAIFEMGATIAAVVIWRQLGRDLPRAVAIGAGAGAFEALLLGLASVVGMLTILAGVPGREDAAAQVQRLSDSTRFLARRTDRTCNRDPGAHGLSRPAPSRHHSAPLVMAAAGFAVFTLLDGIAGYLQVADAMNRMSLWWVELSLVPAGLVSIVALVWLHKRHAHAAQARDDA